MTQVAIIGAGQIGEALIAGLVKAGEVEPGAIVATNRGRERQEELAQKYGIRTTGDNGTAVEAADVVFLCVKPQGIVSVLEEVAPSLSEGALVVSMAAGVRLESLQAAAPGRACVRVMPNTPMLLGRGMSIIAAAEGVDAEPVHELLRTVGATVEIEEKDMDAATALAGSSPAYYYLVAEALVEAGVQLGLKRDVATQLASQAAVGAGEMLVAGDAPASLRASVTSPGGTTAAAIRELEESGLRGAFYRAVEACAQRSKVLG